MDPVGGRLESELEAEFEARPESKLVVEFRQPEDTDSTVAMLALLVLLRHAQVR